MKYIRFLIYGAGVIGSIFAGKLIKAGFDVTVLARGERYDELRQKGLILKEAYSQLIENYTVKVTDKLDDNDLYDYILVVMQKTQVDEILPVLSKNKSKNIVFIVNNPSGYSNWINAVGKERIMVGFPSAGGERKDSAVTYFIGKGLSRSFQTTTFGELNGENTERLKLLISAFNKAKIPSVAEKNMDAWQKTHVAVVLSIANVLYKYNSDNYALSKSSKDIRLMINGIKEGFKVIEKLGYSVTPKKLLYLKLPDFLLIPVFKIIMNTKIAETTMAKHTIAAKNEMKKLQDEFNFLIEAANIKTPAIDALKII